MPLSCEGCPKFSKCVKLCEKAERFVNQDYKYQRELPLKRVIFAKAILLPKTTKFDLPFLNPIQNKILTLFYCDGLSYKQIAFRLSGNRKGSLSCGKIDNCIRSAKKRISRFFHINERE